MKTRKELYRRNIVDLRENSRDRGYDDVTITIHRSGKVIAEYKIKAEQWEYKDPATLGSNGTHRFTVFEKVDKEKRKRRLMADEEFEREIAEMYKEDDIL